MTVKRPAPLFVRIPPWVDQDAIRVEGLPEQPRVTNGYLFVAEPPIDQRVSIEFPLAEQEVTLSHPPTDEDLPGEIRVRLRGDAVVAMDSFGADLVFFDGLD